MRTLTSIVLLATILTILILAISGTVAPYLGYSPVQAAIAHLTGYVAHS